MIALKTPIEELSGIAAKKKAQLKRLGITNVRELFWHLPIRWEDFSNVQNIANLEAGKSAVVRARLVSIEGKRGWKSRKHITQGILGDDTGEMKAVWFNQPYLTKVLIPGKTYYLSGKVVDYYGLTLSNPSYERYHEEKIAIHFSGLTSIYPGTESLSQKELRYLIKKAFEKVPALTEHLPKKFVDEEYMLPLPEAVYNIHFPKNKEILDRAIYRLKFEELWNIAFRAKKIREELSRAKSYVIPKQEEGEDQFIKSLPFTLTGEQRAALSEIEDDIAKDHPMNRLLNGEVGSGKTVVALAAMFNVCLRGFQSALMAPTEVLCRQHFETFRKFLSPFDINIAILTRSYQRTAIRGSERESTAHIIKRMLARGDISIIIGTHTLIQKTVVFKKLALAVVDEQHRFGVRQRAELVKAHEGDALPHFLSLTATPIPRTYAQFLYGSLDISILEELPPGRKKIITKIIPERERSAEQDFIAKELSKGRQLYVICPLIEESDALGFNAVTTEAEKLKKIFSNHTIDVLHGRLSGIEKERVLKSFSAGETHILVSTSVVEVGIDVPNATLMIIESPERFGLASLHQFRGRIGRGEHESFFFLMVKDDAMENRRLKALERIESGFKLAEIDLKTRGPGELYGIRQSGFLELKIASLSDIKLMRLVKQVLVGS